MALLEGVAQIAIRVKDLERATEFYREVLGLLVVFEAPGLALLQLGGVRLMLALPSAPAFDHPASIVYYRVADVGGAHEALLARGVRFEAASHVTAELAQPRIGLDLRAVVDGEPPPPPRAGRRPRRSA